MGRFRLRAPLRLPLTGAVSVAGDVESSAGSLGLVAGELKSIHLNDLSDLDPCPDGLCWYSQANKQNGPWVLWTGAVYAPDYSALGAMVYWGGGHSGYDGTEAYLFDLTTRMWSVLGAPVATDYLADIDPTWTDYLQDEGYVPPASHTYSLPTYISPANGGGTKGSFCLPYNVYGPDEANEVPGNNFAPHVLDLATGQWSRLTTNTWAPTFGGGPNGGSIVDKRGVLWSMPGFGGNVHAKIDLLAETKTVVEANFWAPGYYFVPCYVPELDVMICPYCDYGTTEIKLVGYDLSSGSPVAFTITQATTRDALGPGVGIDWCPETQKFYLYDGSGETDLHVLTPGAVWDQDDWTWATETMGGEAPADAAEVFGGPMDSDQVLSKWKYNRAAKAFMWSMGTVARQCTDGVTRAGAFQLYRPLGVS